MSSILFGCIVGLIAWFLMRYLVAGLYTVNQNERAVKTCFGRAERIGNAMTADSPIAEGFNPEEKELYNYPQLRVIEPGGPYFKWPWEEVHKVVVSTQTLNMALDPENPGELDEESVLGAVTKDQLNTGLKGQIRWHISQHNLYAYLFGIKQPITHVMGYFVSVLRERIANFEAQLNTASGDPDALHNVAATAVIGISINDLRKNLSAINDNMDCECSVSAARYGISLDASLITGIDPPHEVESALAAINTAYNQVSSDISLAQASADQKIVQSKRAVEIETLKAQAEVQPLLALAGELQRLKGIGPGGLRAYVRNVRLKLYATARSIIVGERTHE
jgi:regulator of protease activity HflC (stomatin/prohibitin superfamily)